MYAVMGITGNVGGAVARTLLAKGEKVRGIVRNLEKAAEWQKQGAELFKADYDDVDALTAAFTGVAGVFVMVPPNFAPAPGFAETKATLKVLHAALSRALPSKAVYLSSIGAEQASGLGLITSSHLLEETLGDLPFSHAFLRAGWFFENSAGDLASARNEGKIRFQLHPLDRKFPLVSTADIGKVGAETLPQGWTGIRHIEVAGPESYSPSRHSRCFRGGRWAPRRGDRRSQSEMRDAMGFTGDAGGTDGASSRDGRWIQFQLDSLWRTRNRACGRSDVASCGDNPARDSQLI